jgi:type IV pilus assembly protein PilV
MKGFTIIEILIAIFILVVGILGVLSAFPLGTKFVTFSRMSSVAIQLAQEKMEEIISQSYDNISSSTEDYGKISGFEAYKRVTEVNYYDPENSTITTTNTGIKKIKITVFWHSPLWVSERSINLITLFTRR